MNLVFGASLRIVALTGAMPIQTLLFSNLILVFDETGFVLEIWHRYREIKASAFVFAFLGGSQAIDCT